MNEKKLKFLGMVIFFTILMDVVPYFGFLNVGTISITNLHIPAILTSIVLGPVYGVCIGGLFGIISLMRAVSRESTVLDVLLQNPMISILPRLVFPLISGYLFKLLQHLTKRRLPYLNVTLSAIAGTAANSMLVLLTLHWIYPRQLMEIFKLTESSGIFVSLEHAIFPNMLLESLNCIIVSIFVFSACRKKLIDDPK